MKKLLTYTVAILTTLCAMAQESSNSGVRRRQAKEQESQTAGVTGRMKSFLGNEDTSLSEGDVQWLRIIYRELDLNKDENAALYFPEDIVDGQENLIRIILRLISNNEIPAYEYLDGKEIFSDQYRIDLKENLERFGIYVSEAKGSTEKNRKYLIDENDVPVNEVLKYLIIERWSFDNRMNRMKTTVDAICPIMVTNDGYEDRKTPMFWVKYNDLRPHLAQQEIFISDDNNLPSCTYDDFFAMNLYEGDIVKTRNLKNRALAAMYDDPDDLKRAQDSIQARLDSFENKLWVPNREEIIAEREAREAAEAGDSTLITVKEKKIDKEKKSSTRSTSRSSKKSSKVKESKPKSTSNSSSATRSVRRKKN